VIEENYQKIKDISKRDLKIESCKVGSKLVGSNSNKFLLETDSA
jgi:hypothetical protein